MESWHARLFINAMAELVRVEGMKAENEACKHRDESPKYGEDDFSYVASAMESIGHELANS